MRDEIEKAITKLVEQEPPINIDSPRVSGVKFDNNLVLDWQKEFIGYAERQGLQLAKVRGFFSEFTSTVMVHVRDDDPHNVTSFRDRMNKLEKALTDDFARERPTWRVSFDFRVEPED